MAKKNSSKTATEAALKASEPKLQVFTGWQGINIKEAPLGWEPRETGWYDTRQVDLKPNFLLIQNNLSTTDNGTIETRPDTEIIGQTPSDHSGAKFTGVACLYHRWLFCVMREAYSTNSFKEYIVWRDINSANKTTWNTLRLHDAETNGEPTGYEIREIGYYETKFIALTLHKADSGQSYEGEIFTGDINYTKNLTTTNTGIQESSDSLSITGNKLYSSRLISNPTALCTVAAMGDLYGNSTGATITDSDGVEHEMTTRLDICYTYVNMYGSTLPSPVTTYYFDQNPVSWSAAKFAKISGNLPNNLPTNHGITGVDVYASLDEAQTKVFIGHFDFNSTPASNAPWSITWLGSMSDLSYWTNVQTEAPTENNTKGVSATHFANHDSRLYFWGDPDMPYRLYIGGNPGSELSVALGLGGSYIDIEPGTGFEIMGTAKWKTVSGANIVTIMCGNPNTNKVNRFNLVETNLTVSNEYSAKGYMYEEVSNVQGCNSRWGYGVFADGLYSVNRYGLMLTTMAMEYNSQMRSTNKSDAIQPIFTERLGNRLKDARMVCIDDVIYIILSENASTNTPTNLDQVILCYDIDLQAWYTYTYDKLPTDHGELILHAMAIDSDEHVEGLGLITENEVRLYPTTGIQNEVAPAFNVLIETGELVVKQPKQTTHYLCQLELRFDYFIGQAECLIEGVDYYGRPFKVYKKLNRKNESGVLRDWIEWIRIDKLVESYRIRIIGKARFRLVSINAKVFTQSTKIGVAYGYDDHNWYKNRHSSTNDINHYIKDYNNLRRVIVT